MILDELSQAARYAKLHPGFALGFEFLSRGDLASLASGRHELDGESVFALINRDPGRGAKVPGSKRTASTSTSNFSSRGAKRSAGGRSASAATWLSPTTRRATSCFTPIGRWPGLTCLSGNS